LEVSLIPIKFHAKVEFKSFADRVAGKILKTTRERVQEAASFLKDTIIDNISTSVDYGVNTKGNLIVTRRSKPGEYPRAEVTRLMQSIFFRTKEVSPGVFEGTVGTTSDYGAILEFSEKLDRSFLRRTMNEKRFVIIGILTRPIT
jgi:hypothetical protein